MAAARGYGYGVLYMPLATGYCLYAIRHAGLVYYLFIAIPRARPSTADRHRAPGSGPRAEGRWCVLPAAATGARASSELKATSSINHQAPGSAQRSIASSWLALAFFS
jgi:hypothetical protein